MSAKLGRKTKCTPEVIDRICSLLKQGNYLETAASAAGCDHTTVRVWLKRGAEEHRKTGLGDKPIPVEAPFLQFYLSATEAMAISEAALVGCVSRAGTKEWPAALAILERRHPSRWALKVRAEVQSWARRFLEAAREKLSPDELEKVRAVIEDLEVNK